MAPGRPPSPTHTRCPCCRGLIAHLSRDFQNWIRLNFPPVSDAPVAVRTPPPPPPGSFAGWGGGLAHPFHLCIKRWLWRRLVCLFVGFVTAVLLSETWGSDTSQTGEREKHHPTPTTFRCSCKCHSSQSLSAGVSVMCGSSDTPQTPPHLNPAPPSMPHFDKSWKDPPHLSQESHDLAMFVAGCRSRVRGGTGSVSPPPHSRSAPAVSPNDIVAPRLHPPPIPSPSLSLTPPHLPWH